MPESAVVSVATATDKPELSTGAHTRAAALSSNNRLVVGLLASVLISLPILLNERQPKSNRILDFVCFYGAGKIASTSPEKLYSPTAQRYTFQQLSPTPEGASSYGFFSYPPFAVLPFAWLSRVPYWVAFRLDQGLCLLLYLGMLALMIRRLFPERIAAVSSYVLPLSVAYFPFIADTWLNGQLSILGFAGICLALSEQNSGHRLRSGLSLSLLCYKPTLLILLLPMLLFRKQWRILSGFALGIISQIAVAVIAFGWSIWSSYCRFVLLLGEMEKNRPLAKYTDLVAFFSLLVNPHIGPWLAIGCACAIMPLLIRYWLKESDSMLVWSTTVALTLVLNAYVPVYDTILILPSVLVSIQRRVRAALWLALMIFATSWLSEAFAITFRVQLLTIALLAVATWEIMQHRRIGRTAA